MLTMPEGMQKNAATAYANVQAQAPMTRQARAEGTKKAQAGVDQAQSSQVAGDNAYEVLPGENRKGTGIYSIQRDQSGAQQISFDRPARFGAQLANELINALPTVEAPTAQEERAPGAPAGDAAFAQRTAPSRTPEKDAAPQRAAGGATANTDRVDAEIERLKQREQNLERQAASSDPEKKEEAKQALERVKSELRIKDNDAYRRANTKFTKA